MSHMKVKHNTLNLLPTPRPQLTDPLPQLTDLQLLHMVPLMLKLNNLSLLFPDVTKL